MTMTRMAAQAALLAVLAAPAAAQAPSSLALAQGWAIQSSARVHAAGGTISTPVFRPDGWFRASAPSTVLAALVEDGVYPDPYFGMNLRAIPGTTYPIGRNFSNLEIPSDSPFRVSWWYRTSFRVPAAMKGRRLTLHLDGVNYRANVWLNGRRLASSSEIVGTYRLFELDVTDVVSADRENVLAVEVLPPGPTDLAWTWVDWNPMPPDRDMGLYRAVSLSASGDVVIRHPMVASTVAPSHDRADLTVSADVRNLTGREVRGVLRGRIEDVAFEQAVTLGPHETRAVRVSPDRSPGLRVEHPRLWWPAGMGAPDLHRLDLWFDVGRATSDRQSVRFGIREITSELTATGARLFRVNGRPLLVRGGGWAPDMLLRADPERQAAELAYVRDLGLNTVRLEGKLDDDHFFELADEYGLLVLAGWCCCDQWEQWAKWTPENREVASASQHDRICRLRGHPSVLAWLDGSDNPPPPDVERMYVDVLKALDWPNPYLSSATARSTPVTGATGVKMSGPYDWVPPSYWMLDREHGGAFGFNTETGPGAAVPPVESLRRMLGADHLWPIDDVWNFHSASGRFKNVETFTAALEARYGKATGVDDYARKAQLMTYEGERAMFEAYTRNRYGATGVIQWMLNNAWPGLFWHLWDDYLRPAGGYFGTKKACEPVHVLYSYDDRTVVVSNLSGQPLGGATVRVKVLNLDSTERYSAERTVDVGADGSAVALTLPELTGLSPTWFVALRLTDAGGRERSTNVYWLSTKPDVLDWDKTNYYITPDQRLRRFHRAEGSAAGRGPDDDARRAGARAGGGARHPREPRTHAGVLRPAADHEGGRRRGGAAGAVAGQRRDAAARRDARAHRVLCRARSRRRARHARRGRLERGALIRGLHFCAGIGAGSVWPTQAPRPVSAPAPSTRSGVAASARSSPQPVPSTRPRVTRLPAMLTIVTQGSSEADGSSPPDPSPPTKINPGPPMITACASRIPNRSTSWMAPPLRGTRTSHARRTTPRSSAACGLGGGTCWPATQKSSAVASTACAFTPTTSSVRDVSTRPSAVSTPSHGRPSSPAPGAVPSASTRPSGSVSSAVSHHTSGSTRSQRTRPSASSRTSQPCDCGSSPREVSPAIRTPSSAWPRRACGWLVRPARRSARRTSLPSRSSRRTHAALAGSEPPDATAT